MHEGERLPWRNGSASASYRGSHLAEGCGFESRRLLSSYTFARGMAWTVAVYNGNKCRKKPGSTGAGWQARIAQDKKGRKIGTEHSMGRLALADGGGDEEAEAQEQPTLLHTQPPWAAHTIRARDKERKPAMQ